MLDLFDSILEKSVAKERPDQWSLPIDEASDSSLKDLLIHVIGFTSLLIEHSFSRHLYNSMEHLTTLLSSSDMQIVLAVLNLLYVFSKRSNFISRLNSERRQALILRLNFLAEVSDYSNVSEFQIHRMLFSVRLCVNHVTSLIRLLTAMRIAMNRDWHRLCFCLR